MRQKILIFFSFKQKRDGPRQGLAQVKVPSPNSYIENIHNYVSTFKQHINFLYTNNLRSDKYLDSPPDGATIAREIYYHVVHCRRRLLPKFQPNRTRSFVLIACGLCRLRNKLPLFQNFLFSFVG